MPGPGRAKVRNIANEDPLAWSLAHDFTHQHVRELTDASTSTIKFRARLAELLADLRAGKFHPIAPTMFFPRVAKGLLQWALENFHDMSACPCCTLGHEPLEDDVGQHDAGCPLSRFTQTEDVQLLEKWAKSNTVVVPPLSLAERAFDIRQQLEALELECEKAGYREAGQRAYGARLLLRESLNALTDAIVPAVPQRSAVYCGHANEVPHVCPCPADCTCKGTMCKPSCRFCSKVSEYTTKDGVPLCGEVRCGNAYRVM